MPIKLLLLGGGVRGFVEEGGVEAPILFLWAWGFFRLKEVRVCKRVCVAEASQKEPEIWRRAKIVAKCR